MRDKEHEDGAWSSLLGWMPKMACSQQVRGKWLYSSQKAYRKI